MHEMNEFERLVADELTRDAGPVLPVDDRAIFETASTARAPRWRPQPLFRMTSHIAAGIIVALFGGFLLVGVVVQPTSDGIPAAGGTASPEGTLSASPTLAPTTDDPALSEAVSDPKETDVIKLKTPLATALAAGLLATPAATAVAQADLMEPARVTGTTTFPEDVVAGSRAWIDGATRGDGRIVTHEWEASDPRLDGLHTTTYSYDSYDRQEMMVAVGTVTHENDGGRWIGEASYMGGLDLGGTTTMVMYGEDAYEGLTAYVVIDEESGPISFSAVIFPGDMPAPPIED
jgi:hypothetical protein